MDVTADLETNEITATLETNEITATLETNEITATLETNEITATLETNEITADLTGYANQGTQGIQGETGDTGATGETGATGAGVAAGGTTGQVLSKKSTTNYDTEWTDVAGTGDMTKAVYDPDGINDDAFDMDNMVEGTLTKILTADERTILSNTTNTNSGDNATNTLYSGLEASKQDTLVSGTNIKTINSTTILGSGNIDTPDTTYVSSDFTHNDLSGINAGTDNEHITETQETNFEAAYTHIGESGASHTYIDQSVISGSSPTFDGNNFTGIDADDVAVDVTNFDGILSATDVDVQTALETIDDIDSDDVSEGTTNLYNQTHTGDVTGSEALTIGAAKVTEAMQILADNTTNDVSITKHGYVPKAANTGQFLKDDGTWATPAGSGNVSTSGTPVANDIPRFVNGTDIEGLTYAELKDALNLEIGSDVQAYAANLSEWSGVNPSTNGKSLVSAVDYAAMRTLLNIADGSTANSADATLLARANHTGTQVASTISDFDTEVANNTAVALNTDKLTNVSTNLSEGTSTTTTVDVNSSDGTNATLVSASTSRAGLLTKAKFDEIVANTLAKHDAVTVTDTDEIDLTLTGQEIKADIKSASIDETKLDTSVNASLDLADSSTQPGDLGTAAAEDVGYFATAAQGSTADSAMQDLTDDTTPQLSADLDLAGFALTDSTNNTIDIKERTFVLNSDDTYPLSITSNDGAGGGGTVSQAAGALDFTNNVTLSGTVLNIGDADDADLTKLSDISSTATEIDTTVDDNVHQEALNNALKFDGASSKAISGSFTSLNVGTIYFEVLTGNMNETSSFIASFSATNDYVIYKSGSTGEKWRITTNSNTYGSETVLPNTRYKIVFRWNGTTYDIFINGSKDTLAVSDATTQLALTKLALSYWESSSNSWTEQNIFEFRADSSAITEVNALLLTAGTITPESVLPAASTELVYTNFDSITTVTNSGTTASANLTGTDLTLAEDITNFGLLAENGQLLEDKYGLGGAGALVNLTANETTTASTDLSIPWDTATYDTDSFWSSGAATRLTIPAKYNGATVLVQAGVRWDSDATGGRFASIFLNGSIETAVDVVTAGSRYERGYANLGKTFHDVSTGDYFVVTVNQSSGGDLDVTTDTRTFFQITVIK